MNEADAVTNLIGHIPVPGQDVTSAKTRWEAARNALEHRPPYRRAVPTLRLLLPEWVDRATAFQRRPDVVGTFGAMDWQVGAVDLNDVLSFQKLVVEEQAVDRVNAAVRPDDPASVFSFCLPDPSGPINLPGALDQDQKGITFSSLNPNLRLGGHVVVDLDVAPAPGQPPQKQKFIGFTIHFGSTFVTVAEYGGRWFVRDGYHRCYGLLRRGITSIPCVFVRARSFDEVGAAAPVFFLYEVLFGDRPPFLKDFLDDSVSTFTKQLATRKAVRISAAEFVVAV